MASTMLGFLHSLVLVLVLVLAPISISLLGSRHVAARHLLQPHAMETPTIDKSTFPAFQEPLIPPNFLPILPFPPFPSMPTIPSLPFPTVPTLPGMPSTMPSLPSFPGGVPLPPVTLRSENSLPKLHHKKMSP